MPLTACGAEPSRREGALKPYGREAESRTLELLETTLADRHGREPSEAIRQKLLESAPRDVEELLPQLEKRAEDLAATAIERLRQRGEREQRLLTELLEHQQKQVSEQLARYEENARQLALDLGFDLDGVGAEESANSKPRRGAHPSVRAPEREPQCIRDFYEVRATRIEPVGSSICGRRRTDGQQERRSRIQAHLEWLGFVQPTGLVVSAPALVKAGAILDRSDVQGQSALRECAVEQPGVEEEPGLHIPDFETFARQVLGWSFSPKFYVGTEESPMPEELEVALPEYGETLRADYAVREPMPEGSLLGNSSRVLEPGRYRPPDTGRGPSGGSEHGRMERLLRRRGVLAGLIFNGETVRLISARGARARAGWISTSPYADDPGRPISTPCGCSWGSAVCSACPAGSA